MRKEMKKTMAETKPIKPMGGAGRRMQTMGPRPTLKKGTAKRMFAYFKSYWPHMLAVVFCIILSALAGVKSSTFMKTLIDGYITPMLNANSHDFSGLLGAIIQVAMIYIVGIVSTFSYNYIMVIVSQGIMKKVRDNMFDHMQTLPLRYFDAHTHGDIMSHYTNDTDTLQMMLSQSIPQIISSAFTIVFVFVSMLTISWMLTVFVIICIFGMMLITKKIAQNSSKYFVKQQKSIGGVNGYIEEMINGQKVIKVFCHEEIAKEEFDAKNEELFENASKANKFANIMGPVMNNLGNLQYVLIAVVGGALAVANIPFANVTLGGVASFLLLSKSFTMPINQIAQQFNSIVMALAGAERIFGLLDEAPEQDDGYVTLVNAEYVNGELKETNNHTGIWAWKHPHSDGTLTYSEVKGDVILDGVDFGYVPEKQVLYDVSVYAKPGQKVAFVGSTGAGKTTITNLINRFYDIADGKIRYDGININKIKKSDLRRSLGVVLQDVNLFTGTVMENIRYGKLDATDEECIAAAKLANAHSFIEMLPNGYDTVLSGDGSGLSQGQRQLISIARAAVADPPVMILDEATSSIDTRTESIVQKGMDSLMKGRTVFVIAHRLSTVRNSDVIMVLENGKIIERGNHEQLIAEKGKYYQLYTGAFEME